MGFAWHYLESIRDYTQQIVQTPSDRLAIIVVIPAYKEDDLLPSLNSLRNCTPPNGDIELLVVINCPENSPAEILRVNKAEFETVCAFKKANETPEFRVYPLVYNDLPAKEAGVGLARKLGMDEAVCRFNAIDIPGGIIASFDADALCDSNYLTSLYDRFKSNEHTSGCSVYFEHSLDKARFGEQAIASIIQYELHLRYYNQALRMTGFPYAFHTVGSSFAVQAGAYAKQGGMNRKKAGEDFYFLQKIIPLGNYFDITSTRILLSSRVSDRAPFGTGAAMGKMLSAGESSFPTYDLQAFSDIKVLFDRIPDLYKAEIPEIEDLIILLPEPVKTFLTGKDFPEAVMQMSGNSASPEVFKKRFFQWWNAFRIMKYLNFSHQQYYARCSVIEQASRLLSDIGGGKRFAGNDQKLLELYRTFERTGSFI